MNYDNLRRQYAKNAEQMEALAAQAETTGRKVRGQTTEFWRDKAVAYRAISAFDNAALREHLTAAQRSVSTRLAEIRLETSR